MGIFDFITSPVASVATSLFGGLLGSKSESSQRSADRTTNALSIAEQQKDRQLQQDFAQQGIRWRTEDAVAAGIHPLYAMGASLPTYSPVSSGLSTRSPRYGNALGQGVASAGQNLSRAFAATRTTQERQLSLERAGLENELLRSRIALNASQIGPGFPSVSPSLTGLPGQDSSRLTNLLQERTVPHRLQGQSEPGAITDRGFAYTGTGWAPVPSKDVKERIEDQIIPEMAWGLRNYGPANFGGGSPPPFAKPSGQKWVWAHGKQEWQLKPATRRRPNMRRPGGRPFRKPWNRRRPR